ncbi:hypothetical protein HAX54_048607 [Datura stramonium]|uniref:NPH3 domain-containing protein n=1 Tax=Datura stramonium TaxID=4076 RepID=A0ABS8SUR6_DATST|nr:hypothetical protein [Datura stramonium]
MITSDSMAIAVDSIEATFVRAYLRSHFSQVREPSTHAAQNERLPLRVIVQVLFFEQLRLRTSISGWFFVSENLENSQNLSGATGQNADNGARGRGSSVEDMKERVSELEKECNNLKEEFQKMVKTKRRWNIFCRRKSPCNSEIRKPSENVATYQTVPKIH